MSSRLGRMANVQRGEERVVGRLFGASFLVGVALVYTLTAANALFIGRIGAEALPLAYLGTALVLPAVGGLHLALQRRLDLARLLGRLLFVIPVAFVLLRLALETVDSRWIALVVLVWYDVALLLLNLELWAVAGRLLDLRQARRLYGLIGSGEVAAGVLGGLTAPVVVPLVGTENLLLVAALAAAGALATTRAVLIRETGSELQDETRGPAAPRLRLPEIVRGRHFRYQRLLLLLVAVSFFAYYVVDRLFYERVQLRYPDPDELAAFLGLVIGVADLAKLAVRIGVGPRFARRFGLGAGLMLLPAIVALGAVVVLAAVGLGEAVLVFWLAVLLKWGDRVVRHSVDRGSTLILYRPLPLHHRTGTQAIAEGVVGPLAGGLAGLFLLVAEAAGGAGPVTLAVLLLCTGVFWAMVAAAVRNEYGPTVAAPITRREREASPVAVLDEEGLRAVGEALAGDHAGRIRSALDLMEGGVPGAVRPAVAALARHPSPAVRLAVLGRRSARGTVDAGTLRSVATGDPVPEVRAAALQAVAEREGPGAMDVVRAHLEDPDPEVRGAAWRAALRLDPDTWGPELSRAASKGEADARRAAARAAGAAPRDRALPLLTSLLEDPDPETRRQAVLAACSLDDAELWPRVLEHVADTETRSTIVAGLRPGYSVRPALEAALADPARGPSERAHLLRLAGVLGGLSSGELALPFVGDPDPVVRHAALEAMAMGGYRAASADRAGLTDRIEAEARGTAKLLRLGEAARAGGLWELARFIDEDVARQRDRMLLLLAPLSTPEAVVRARAVYLAGSRAHRISALELVEHLLSARLRRLVLPLLEGSRLPRELRRVEVGDDPIAVILSGGRDGGVGPLTVAVALDSAARRARVDLADEVEAHARSTNRVVREMAARCLRALGRGASPDDPDPAFSTTSTEAHVLTTVEKIMVLRSVDVFSTTPGYLLADIAGQLEPVELEAGEMLFAKGSLGVSLYIVVSGRLRVHDGERGIAELGEHDVVGEMSALDPEPRSASVSTLEPTRLLRLDQATLLDVITDRSEVARGIIQVLCRRLRAASR